MSLLKTFNSSGSLKLKGQDISKDNLGLLQVHTSHVETVVKYLKAFMKDLADSQFCRATAVTLKSLFQSDLFEALEVSLITSKVLRAHHRSP